MSPDKVDVLGVGLSVTDYEDATEHIARAAVENRSYGVSALAVHGLMEAASDEAFREQVNRLDLVTPDGQPVRWAMNALHDTDLGDRVSGPDLTWHVVERAAELGVGVFLFGSTPETAHGFAAEILRRFPTSRIVGVQPDRFRDATTAEDEADIQTINDSGAGVVLVGRGCPLQEKWVADHLGKINASMLAVGAAFDYGAGTLSPPPAWMQRIGLQWFFRLCQEPRRLYKRYAVTNSAFVARIAVALWKKRR